VIEATQEEKGKKQRNDRLLAKVEQSRSYADLTEIDQLGEGFCEELRTFFATYNELKGKKFKVGKTGNARRAFKILLEGIRTAAQRGAGAA
jgi:inorganic pyrophosphatase